jgi:hypothetical protein
MDRYQGQGSTERRREPRFVTAIDSRLLWDGASEPVTIEEISCYGALLNGKYLPEVGSRVTIVADCLEVVGTIIWTGADQCGVLLSSPVEPLELIRERPVRTRNWTPVPPPLPAAML